MLLGLTSQLASEIFFESKKILGLSIPSIFSYVSIFLIQTESLVFLGHLPNSQDKQAGASLGISFLSVMGYSIVFGFSSSIDTLASQAFGAKSYPQVSVWFQRSSLVVALMTIPIIMIMVFSEDILVGLAQNKDIAHYAGRFCRFGIIGLVPIAQFESAKKWLMAQNIVWPGILSAFIGNLINILFCYLFINVSDFGFDSVPIAFVLCDCSQLISLYLIIYMKDLYKLSWTPIDIKIILDRQGLKEVFSIGVFGALMLWYFTSHLNSLFILGLTGSHLIVTQL